MKFSTSTIKLSLGASLLWNGAMISAATGCNADNCLRALFPTGSPTALSSALAFCATYTTTLNTATTGFPTRATAGCGASPSRYSSACSCKPTPSPTPSCAPVVSPANLVKNGGFECGLAPWTAGDAVNTLHKLSQDGSNTAYEFNQIGPQDPGIVENPSFLSQDISGLTVYARYNLTLSLFFDACTSDTGFVGVKLGGQIGGGIGGFTYNPCDQSQIAVGRFASKSYVFQARTETENLRIEFLIQRQGAVVKVDNVVVVRAY